MESYRFITHVVTTITIGSPELNLSARQEEQNLGQVNEPDTSYITSLREHYHLM